MDSINFVSPNIGINNYDKQLIEEGLCNSNQRENSNLYSLPGILHFLQSEWNKMESERAHWEVEKAELTAKIAFLQGEKKGQESLKEDLVRRIKMLEYALKQRNKTITELKYGVSNQNIVNTNIDSSKNNADEMIKSKYDTKSKFDNDMEKAKAASAEWRESRQRLRGYLQEVGYVDSIVDVRQFRLKNLLVDGPVPKLEDQSQPRRMDESLAETENSIMKSFDFLNQEKDKNNKGDEFSNEVNHFDSKQEDLNWTSQFSKKYNSQKMNDDADKSVSSKTKMKIKFGRGSKKDSELQDFLATLSDENGVNEEFAEDKDNKKNVPPPNGNDVDNFTSNLGLGDLAGITVANDIDGELGDSSKPYCESGAPTQSGLATDKTDSGSGSTAHSYWNLKFTLRGHFDSVRCTSFYKAENAVLSGSDDGTVKVWNFGKPDEPKRVVSSNTNNEIEAVQTMRGHDGAVLSVQVFNEEQQLGATPMAVSGGIDGGVRLWNLPNLDTEPYDPYDATQNALCIPDAHNEAVWTVGCMPNDPVLFSASPYTIKLWSFASAGTDISDKVGKVYENGYISCYLNKTYELADLVTDGSDSSKSRITKVSLLKHDASQLVVSTSTGKIYIIDLQSGSVKYSIDLGKSDGNNNSSHSSSAAPLPEEEEWSDFGVTGMASHPTLPLVFCGHKDGCLRTVDLRDNSIVHSMIVHQDAVTCIDIEECGIYLLTGSHDGSLRMWDVQKRSCVQEIASHRSKHNESVHSVEFHSRMPFIGSSGADGVVKVYS